MQFYSLLKLTFNFLQKVFNEEQLFTILRIIQNYENRKDIFKEGKKFNMSKKEMSQIDELIEIDQERQAPIEIENNFDIKSWNEFLNDISHKVADNFVNSSIEV